MATQMFERNEPTLRIHVKLLLVPSLVVGLGTGGITGGNGFSHGARPRDKAFETLIAILQTGKAGFKGLQHDPQATGKKGQRPGNKDQEKDP